MDDKLLRRLQFAELEILDDIVSVCEKHGIRYYLYGGTLLGAIRHKGFIPWDDDIDIAMPRKDYNRFKTLFVEEMGTERYFIQDKDTEPLHYLPFVKIRKHGTVFEELYSSDIDVHKGIYVDVFMLDNATNPDNPILKLQVKMFQKIYGMIWCKTITASKPEKTKGEKRRVMRLWLIRLDFLKTIQHIIMTMNRNDASGFHINFVSGNRYKKETFAKEKFDPPAKVEFEGRILSVPNDWNHVLANIYGDYMELPPPEKRATHNASKIQFENGECYLFGGGY